MRLLTFPEFLDRFIERLLILKERFRGAASVVGGLGSVLKNFGGGAGAGGGASAGGDDALDDEPKAVTALSRFQSQMRDLQTLLLDGSSSEFVIVSIPTALSLAESERLQSALGEQGIAVRRGVLNRLIPPESEDTYVSQLAKGQAVCLDELRQLADRSLVSVTEVPYFDVEVRAVYGLRALGAALFVGAPSSPGP